MVTNEEYRKQWIKTFKRCCKTCKHNNNDEDINQDSSPCYFCIYASNDKWELDETL